MAAAKGPCKRGHPSIKYTWDSAEGKSFKIVDFVPEECVASFKKQSGKKHEPEFKNILSTAGLISAVDQIWDCANHLPVFRPKANFLNRNCNSCLKEEILDDLDKGEYGRGLISSDSKSFKTDPKASAQVSPALQPKVEFLRVTEKIAMLEPHDQDHRRSLFCWFLHGDATSINQSWTETGVGIGNHFEKERVYHWMKEIVPAGIINCNTCTEIEKKGKGKIPENTSNTAGNLVVTDDGSALPTSKDSLSSKTSEIFVNTGITTSLASDYLLAHERHTEEDKIVCSDYLLAHERHTEEDKIVLRNPSSSLCADYHIDVSSSMNKACEDLRYLADGKELLKFGGKQPETEIPSSSSEVTKYALAKQEHAFAGALAGISVSLCLHPLDTVKTIIQSRRMEQKSLCCIGKSVVSERGFTGLYRGISSNIAFSAPISALYTFTYESVKGALLPLFPKEYCSFAHCIAGGCASVATSFIFTPSERIKQQMQVGSHYANCWHALLGIIRKGGLPSLYAGWGAVLCRNVPHSIIKFYAYESFKQMMLSPLDSSAQPNTLQTLVCGGLAGSTAAFFSTPFDVVKTRLQTQIPGSRNQYDNVFQAVQEIGKQEGLRGLYRGVIPRLVMYMSQGALFFASYEFFRSLFALGVPQITSSRIQHRPNDQDNSQLAESASQSASSAASSSSSPRLQSVPS